MVMLMAANYRSPQHTHITTVNTTRHGGERGGGGLHKEHATATAADASTMEQRKQYKDSNCAGKRLGSGRQNCIG